MGPVNVVGRGLLLAVLVLGGVHAVGAETEPDRTTQTTADLRAQALQPLPLERPSDGKKIALGERLFHDPRLSGSGQFACVFCHSLDHGGGDGLPKSVDIRGGFDQVNTPTIFNSRYNFRQTWNGRYRTLGEQLDGVIRSPAHMASDWLLILSRLRGDAQLVGAFKYAYPEGMTIDTIRDALLSFERSMVTPNAPFDRYLRGDLTAISEDQKSGYLLFKSYGCVACHQGRNVGGNLFAKLGVFRKYFKDGRYLSSADVGLFAVTGKESDRYKFRVPSLRNVDKTAPYLHDGSAKDLDEVIDIMGRYQLGRDIPEAERKLIAIFLKTLTGEYRGKSL